MVVCKPGDDGESSSACDAKKWLAELPPASFTTAVHDGGLRDRATDHCEMRLGFPKVCMLTAELAGGSKLMIMAGDELTAMNSGELQ
jgi:hypothetical protein